MKKKKENVELIGVDELESVRITKADFELFKSECDKWIEFWKMSDIEVIYNVAEECDTFMANFEYYEDSCGAIIRIASEWPKLEYSKYQIRRAAFHEVAEMMLCNLSHIAKERARGHEEEIRIVSETHKIVRRLENVLFNGVFGNKEDGDG